MNAIHRLILERFIELQAQGFKQADLARRIGKSPEQITRWIQSPGNLELRTVAEILLGLGGELEVRFRDFATVIKGARHSRLNPTPQSSLSQLQQPAANDDWELNPKPRKQPAWADQPIKSDGFLR